MSFHKFVLTVYWYVYERPHFTDEGILPDTDWATVWTTDGKRRISSKVTFKQYNVFYKINSDLAWEFTIRTSRYGGPRESP